MANRKRQDFLQEILGRVAVVGYCHRALCDLADGWRAIETERAALPRDPENPNRTSIPEYLVEREEEWLTRVDAQYLTRLLTKSSSLLGLLRQLDIVPTESLRALPYPSRRSETACLARSAPLAGVLPGNRYWRAREGGFLEYGRCGAQLGGDQRPAEKLWGGASPLPLSARQPWQPSSASLTRACSSLAKHSEKFSPDEWARLMAAGVRDCKLEEALRDLAVLLERGAPCPSSRVLRRRQYVSSGGSWWT